MTNDMQKNAFSKRLHDLREDRDLKQEAVAKALNVTRSAYGRYERGEREPQVNFIVNCCNYFNISADYLLGISDERIKLRPDIDLIVNPVTIPRDPYDDLMGEWRVKLDEQYQLLKIAQENSLSSRARRKNPV